MSTTDPGDLERQVATTLESHARDLAVVPRPFEPVRPALDLGGGDPLDPPSSPSRHRVLRAVAAALVVVAGAAAVLVARTADDPEDLRLQAVPGLPEDALIPTWDAPDGWELSGLDWDIDPLTAGDLLGGAQTAQLIGDPADEEAAGRALLVQSNAGGVVDFPERTTVRGAPGRWGPDDRNPDVTTLTWDEDDVSMRATYRGLSTPEVVAVLDALTVRPGGLEEGFDLPTGGLPGGLELLGEASDPDPGTGPTAVSVTFGPRVLAEPGSAGGPPHRARVRTTSPSGGLTADYLLTWFMGGRDDAGVARWWSPSVDPDEASGDEAALDGNPVAGTLDGAPLVGYSGPEHGEAVLRTIGPDGRAVSVLIDDDAVAADGLGAPEDVARDIADSVAPATSEQLSELWEGLIDQWAARDLVAEVPTPAGTVELRGTGSETVLCLRGGEALSCAPAVHPNPNDPPDGGDYDGQWMALVPTDGGDQLVAVSDKGAILLEVSAADEDALRYPDAAEGEADGFWASVFPADPVAPNRDAELVVPLTDVAREAEACLAMLGSGMNPDGARPEDEARIRNEGGGPEALYRACRELTGGSWYRDVGP